MKINPNRLINSSSPYLRQAAYQPIDWYEWSKEAFDKAEREDKPIFLSIGGVWCHWCHVMAHECFKDLEIARLLNENFVSVKVDRDQRPDIDKRYQEVVAALTGTSGWPLTVFLTPKGEAFFGGTYFPLEDRWGLPSFKKVLLGVSRVWKGDREKVLSSARQIIDELRKYKNQSTKGEIDQRLLDQSLSILCDSIDYLHGGLKGKPKFPHAKAIELLIYYHLLESPEKQDSRIKKAIEISLDCIAKGGIFDHLLGGFFRYSTDEQWRIPHFEKILPDNAELLKLYTIAFKVFQKKLYKRIAEGIVRYYKNYGYDPKGGFYASQDADIGLLDEGGYYTFSLEEVEKILLPEEMRVISAYFGLNSQGRMPHKPEKNVLFIAKEEDELAQELNLPRSQIERLLEDALEKMLIYREEKRPLPFIDKTIYTNLNALMIEALCEYWKVFKDEWALTACQKIVTRILDENKKGDQIFHAPGIEGLAEDYLFLSRALVAFYEVTQNKSYFEEALKISEKALELFWDNENYGFYDKQGEKGEGLLKLRRKDLQDSPTSSVNGVAPYLYLLFGSLTDRPELIDYSKKSLEAFSAIVEANPLISFSFLISLYAYLRGIFKIKTEKFFHQALDFFRPFKFVVQEPVEGIIICEGQSCKMVKDFGSLF